MKIVTDCGKVFIRTESGIDLCIIPGIVTVCVRLKDRGKIDGIGAKFLMCGIQSLTFKIRCSKTPSFSNGAPQNPSGYI